VLRELAEGLDYAWRLPSIRMALVLLLVVATLSINITILLAALAAQTLHGDARVFGVLSACFGVGALLGALLTATLARATWPLLLASAGGFGVALLVLAPQRTLPLVLLALAAAGVGCTVYMSTSNALVQLATPGPLQGRVMGLYNYVFVGTALPGALITGWLSQLGGTTLAYLVGGVAAVTMAGVGAAWYARHWHTGTPAHRHTGTPAR
jgi:MFS family permease